MTINAKCAVVFFMFLGFIALSAMSFILRASGQSPEWVYAGLASTALLGFGSFIIYDVWVDSKEDLDD